MDMAFLQNQVTKKKKSVFILQVSCTFTLDVAKIHPLPQSDRLCPQKEYFFFFLDHHD